MSVFLVFFHWSPAFRINSCTRRCTSSSVWSVANLNIMNKSLNKIVQTLFQNLLWKIRMIWKKGNRNLVWNFRQIVWRAGHSAVRALHVFKKVVGQDGSMPHASFLLVDSALLIDRSELWIEVFFFFFGCFLLRMRENLLIYPKMSISRLLWSDRWKLHGEIQRHASLQRTCFWQMTGVRTVWNRLADFNMFQMTYKYNSVSSEDFGSLKFPWKKVQHSESGWYAHDLRYMFVVTSGSPPWSLINFF